MPKEFLQVNAVFEQTELDTVTGVWLVVKLSKFIRPSTDGGSVQWCIVHFVVTEMATVQERAQSVG